MPGYDFDHDLKLDQAAVDGYSAGKESKRVPPSKYVSEDVLLAAWAIGNSRGLAEACSGSCYGRVP